MSFKELLKEERTLAMKSKDSFRLNTIRSILADIESFEITDSKRREATDNDIFGIMRTAIKKRRDSISNYVKGNREDKAQIERDEITIIESLMPEQLTKEETEQIILDIIDKENLSGKGKRAIGVVMKNLKNRMDINVSLIPELVMKNI